MSKEIDKEIEKISNSIDILNSQKMIKNSSCAICDKDGCEVISFNHRKPVHIICHWEEITNPS